MRSLRPIRALFSRLSIHPSALRQRLYLSLCCTSLLYSALFASPQDALAISRSNIDQQRQLLQLQRDQYRQARAALNQRHFDRAEPLINQLQSYPLYPYLLFKRHISRIDQLDATTVAQFSDTFADTPLPARLQRSWLSHLAKRQRWDMLLDNYRPELANTSLQCQRLWALHETGHAQQALTQVAPLWIHGSSRPKACDPLFRSWIKSDHFNQQHAWDRFWLALKRNNTGLAQYVSKHLQPEKKRSAAQALRLHRKPEQIATIHIDPNRDDYQQLILHSLKRLGRTDPALALKQLQRFAEPLNLSTEDEQQLQQRFGLRLLKNYPASLDAVIEQIDPDQTNLALLEWQLRNSILRQDWTEVKQLLDRLPSPDRFKDRWRYWKARALEAKPEHANLDRASNIYAELANERSFYGFLAADKLGSGYRLNNQTELPDRKYLAQLSQSAPLIRARELFHHQQRIDARREWRQATRDLSPLQHHQAARLARQWGWYEQAIRSAIAAQKWNDLMLRFPLAYGVEISNAAQSNKIDMTWILAITRQESAFSPDARSHAGATGLMQLMPGTAKETAKRARVRYRGTQQLIDPALNLRLGSHYLARLSRRYEGNRVLASAAYNAGPNRVNRWLEQRKDLPTDIWIETIPFDETRNYVQNVLSFSVIYSDFLGLPKQLLKPHEQRAVIP